MHHHDSNHILGRIGRALHDLDFSSVVRLLNELGANNRHDPASSQNQTLTFEIEVRKTEDDVVLTLQADQKFGSAQSKNVPLGVASEKQPNMVAALARVYFITVTF